jgi:DDE superfamily endonuclease
MFMLRSIGDRFDMGKSSLEVSFQRVIAALNSMAQDIITWPTNNSAVATTTAGFQNASGFPGTIGAIDGTHIQIKAPTEHGDTYINRKKVHSIVLQAVCNETMRFTDCFAGYPGSVHDARVLRNSPLYLDAQRDYNRWFPNNTHLVGDAAYPLKKWIMVPYRDNGHLTRAQKQYNTKLSATRVVIERAFALLKGRFRRLKMLDMNRTDLIPQCITACCVLHNLCLNLGDDSPDDMTDDGSSSSNNQMNNDTVDDDLFTERQNNSLATQKRIDITNAL